MTPADADRRGARGWLARWLVRLYPSGFRAEYGDELAQFIDDRCAERRFGTRWTGRLALAWHLTSDTVRAAYALTAILTLMLGIGANTAIFSFVSAVLLAPLPYPEPDRIVMLWGARGSTDRLMMSIPDVIDLRARARTLADVGFVRVQSVNLTGTGAPDRLVGNYVTAETMSILGARAAMGRLFATAETDPTRGWGGGEAVAVLSDGAWRARFGADPAIIGRTLLLNGRPHTVIGVTAREFRDPITVGVNELWLPITSAPNKGWFTRGNGNVQAIARLRAGVTVAQVRRDLAGVAAGLATTYPQTNAGAGFAVISLRNSLVGDVQPVLLIVLAFVAVVLLIACANVANLQLARAASRRREMAMRAALGAGRSRLVRQMLTESLVLSLAGGVAGVAFALGAIQVLVASMPANLPVFGSIGLDARVLAYTAAVTIASGLLFGAVPALQAARADLNAEMKVRNADGQGRAGARHTFVAVQLALCIVLLVGAGLLTRSLASLLAVRPGFDPRNLLTAEFRLPSAKYNDPARIREFMARAVIELRAVPGFSSAALVTSVPLSGNVSSASYLTEGQPEPTDGSAPSMQTNTATDGFFRTMRIPLLAGRDFDDRDRADGAPVAIVNETLARRAWANESAIGKRVRVLGPDVWVTVVGVVGDVKQVTLSEPPAAQIYGPVAQSPGIFSSVVARTDGDPMLLANALRSAIWAVDRDQPVWKVRSLEALVARDVAPPRFTMALTVAFALLSLVLAVVGVYGVMSFAVAQRTREVGIRMALGAQHVQVIGLVLARGLRVVAIATVVGLVAAFGAARLIRGQLFGIAPTDAVTFVTVPLLLGAVATVACWLPARRAARVDPVIALRSE
jgi:putative ABC transport system permease protein